MTLLKLGDRVIPHSKRRPNSKPWQFVESSNLLLHTYLSLQLVVYRGNWSLIKITKCNWWLYKSTASRRWPLRHESSWEITTWNNNF